jgi:hypothetical protein
MTKTFKAPHLGIGNKFKAQIIERRHGHPDCGEVVRETEFAPNLILENGMAAIATQVVTTLFAYCCIGSGSTPTQASSGAITATTSGATCTSNTSIFSSGDVGQLIYFPGTGQSALITAYTNNTTVTLSATLAISSGQTFTIFAVNQTGLGDEIHRSNTYLTGSGNCGTTYSDGVYTHTRTYDFPIETSDQTYYEVGFSDTATPGANIFMRGIFSSAPIDIVIGQQIRVIYNVLVTVTPISPRSRTVPISGWPALSYSVAASSSTNLITLVGYGFAENTEIFFEGTDAPGGITFGTTYYVIPNDANTFYISTTPSGGHVTITSDGTDVLLYTNTNGAEQLSGDQFSGVDTNGNTTIYLTRPCNGLNYAIGEPATNQVRGMSMSSDDTALPIYNAAQATPTTPSGGTIGLSAGSYVSGSYQLTYSGTYTVEQGISNAIMKLFTVDTSVSTPYTSGLVYLFQTPQQKTNLYTLTINWVYTWGRIFV